MHFYINELQTVWHNIAKPDLGSCLLTKYFNYVNPSASGLCFSTIPLSSQMHEHDTTNRFNF